MDARLAAAACALAFLPLAGCLEDVGPHAAGPVASLGATPREAWVGEPVTLDGRASHSGSDDPIVLWRFDFGDGSQAEVHSADEARLEHEYAKPGRYVVTLTIETQSRGDREAASDSLTLPVGEKVQVASVLADDPAGLNTTDNASVDLDVHEGASSFAVDLDVNASAVDASRVRATLLDPTGRELEGASVDLEAGSDGRLRFDGLLARAGTYTLRLEALQGSAQVQGEVQVSYAARA